MSKNATLMFLCAGIVIATLTPSTTALSARCVTYEQGPRGWDFFSKECTVVEAWNQCIDIMTNIAPRAEQRAKAAGMSLEEWAVKECEKNNQNPAKSK